MKKALCFLMVAAFMLFTFVGRCEGMSSQVNSAFKFLQDTTGPLQLLDKESLVLRNSYLISLPENRDTINPEVIQAYGGFDHVLLLDIGYYKIRPITESLYECVGVNDDGSFAVCPTPFDLFARTYDVQTFDGVSITSIGVAQ